MMQFQAGISLPSFLEKYGGRGQLQGGFGGMALADWLKLSARFRAREQVRENAAKGGD